MIFISHYIINRHPSQHADHKKKEKIDHLRSIINKQNQQCNGTYYENHRNSPFQDGNVTGIIGI